MAVTSPNPAVENLNVMLMTPKVPILAPTSLTSGDSLPTPSAADAAATSMQPSVSHHHQLLSSPGSTEKENDPKRASSSLPLAGMISPLISMSTPRSFPKPEICAEFKPTPTKFEDCSAAMKQQREEIQARLAARIKASEAHTELLRNLREKDRIIHDLMEQNVLLTRVAAVTSSTTSSGTGGVGSGSEAGGVTPSQSNSSTARSSSKTLVPSPQKQSRQQQPQQLVFRQVRSKSVELKYRGLRARDRSLSGSKKTITTVGTGKTIYSKAIKDVEASDEWSEDRSVTEDSHDD